MVDPRKMEHLSCADRWGSTAAKQREEPKARLLSYYVQHLLIATARN